MKNEVLEWSKQFADFLGETLDGMALPEDPRSMASIALHSLSLEHHWSILKLVSDDCSGSALALVRPQLEAHLRGYWILHRAADELITEIEAGGDPRLPRLSQMPTELASVHEVPHQMISVLLTKVDAMHSFTHAGGMQIGRRFSNGRMGSPEGVGEQIEALLVVNNTIALGAALASTNVCKELVLNLSIRSKVRVTGTDPMIPIMDKLVTK